MADREERKSRRRSRSYSSDKSIERKSRRSSASSSKHKKSKKSSNKSRSRSRSESSSESDHKSRKRRGRSSSSSSSPEERRPKDKKRKSSSKRNKSSRSRSTSSSGSAESSSSESDSEYERKKSKHKKTKKKKIRKKKTKKKDKKSKHAVNQNKYGKYGILCEADQFTKQPEFYCWLQEVKQINPEIVSRLETKKMFETFMEDYNTATLPHKKFYSLAPWEMKQDAKRKMKELKKAQKNTISFADDESNHTKKFKGEEKRYGLSREKIMEMKRSIKERTAQEYKKNVGFE